MFFISFILAFFIFLLSISLINLFLSSSIKLVTGNSIDEYKFIVPSVLYLVINSLTFFIIYVVTTNVLDLSLRDSLMAIVFKTVDISDKIKTVFMLDLIILISSILLQSLGLMTINIDYTITNGKIRMFFKSLLSKINKKEVKIEENTESNENEEKSQNLEKNEEVVNEEKEEVSNLAYVIEEGQMAENKKEKKLNFGNAVICTIFIFSFLFFMLTALFTIGSMISSKIL